MNKNQQIYLALPVFLQNLAVAIEGRQLYIQRYGRFEKEYFNELMRTQFMNPDEMRELQIKRLRCVVNHARENVPYYRGQSNLYSEPESIDDLSKYPVIEKRTVRDNQKAFYDPALPRSELVIFRTSGTTGTPLEIRHNRRNIEYAFALLERLRAWAGVSMKDRGATFGGRIICRPETDSPPFWRYNPSENQMIFSSYHMSEKNLHHYARELIRFQPVEILGYPSSINTLARFLKEHPEYEIRPKAVLTNSEPLYDFQRELMIDVFQCGVFDWYGSVEFISFAGRCEKGNLHIASEFGILEILDGNNKPCPVGVEGEIVCTGLMNTGTTFIRYKIGDRGILSDKTCACGRTLPILAEVTGRTDDLIRTPEGRLIGRMDPVFKGVSGLSECQIIQDNLDHIIFKIVPAPGYDENTRVELLKNARLRLGNSIKIDIEEVSEIKRGPSGKFKAVISKVVG